MNNWFRRKMKIQPFLARSKTALSGRISLTNAANALSPAPTQNILNRQEVLSFTLEIYYESTLRPPCFRRIWNEEKVHERRDQLAAA